MTSKPKWCPHQDCKFLMNNQDLMCVGILSKPEPHGNDVNTHRFCLDERETGHGIHDLQINKTDAWYFKRLFDKILTSETP